MKRLLIMTALCLLALSTLSAQNESSKPQVFSFNIGGLISYNLSNQDIIPSSPFGIQFYFDDTFAAGFTFDSGMDLSLLNLSFTPAENMNVSLYTGQEITPNAIAFGMGFGYDFLVNPDRFYSAVGVYLTWIGTYGGSYDISSGGTFSIGLKMNFGI